MIRLRLLILTLVLAPFLWCFGSVLFRDQSFGFRDAANYYYPLFEWECSEWRAGRVPLWNPLDNGGVPVLADTTSSVLYPGKLVFALPISFRLRYHLYVTAHILLAAGMAYRMARHWRCSVEASGLAALSYAFGGSVLFQYCNVVFLVGAAWLPFGLLAADRMLRERSLGWAVALGATLALMVLGGDPQAAYHTGLLSALYAWLLRGDTATEVYGIANSWRRSRPALLAAAATAGVCLSLVQILPAIELTRQSSRDAPDAPRTLYEVVASIPSGVDASGLFASPSHGTHLQHVYEFSVGPSHLTEFVWPNCFGTIFPRNERWSTAFPGEGRTWTPSLYLGLLPFVLALFSWRVRDCDARVRFVSWLTLFALLGSFGWYGIGWLIHEIRASLLSQPPDELVVGEPVGGLYWLLVTVLPGYVYFRYPAKLLVIASLGISLLAARGWDDLVAVKSRRLAIAFVVIAAASLALAASFGWCQSPWQAWLAEAAPDSVFGPLDVEAATRRLLMALLHAAVLGLTYWFLLRATSERFKATRHTLLLVVTACELCLANGWMTLSIPGSVWSERRSPAQTIVTEPDTKSPPRLYRDPTATPLPKEWGEEGDDGRLADVVSWERATLLPKHHLDAGVALIGSHTTLTSADWQSFLRVASEWDRSPAPDEHGSLLDAMSVQYVATSDDTHSNATIKFAPNSRAFPRVWIVHEIEVLPPLTERSREAIDRRTREVFLENGKELRDLRSRAILESNDMQELPQLPKVRKSEEDAESCAISHYAAQRVEIEVNLEAPGCLILNDSFYPGWHAERITEGVATELAIQRANRVMRAVLLPAGKHRVVYRYRSSRFSLGVLVSGIAWCLAIGSGVRGVLTRRRLVGRLSGQI